MKMSHLPLQAPPPLPVPSHVKKQSEVSASSSVSKEPERSRSRSRSRGRKRSDSPPSEGDESSDTGGKPGFATEGSSIYLPDHGGRALALNHQQDNSGTTAESPENRRRSDLSYSPPPDAKSDTRSQSSLSSGVSTELRTAQAQHMMALPSQDSIRLPLRSIARARGEGAAGPPRPSAAESSPRSDWSHSQSNSCLSESSQLNLWGSERQPPLAPDPLHSPTMSRGATPMGAASSRLSRSGHGGPSFGLSDSPAPAVGGRASGLLASATPARTTPSSLSPPTHMAQPSGAGKGSSPSPSDPPPPPRMPMFPELPSYPRFERDPLIEPEGMKRPQPSRAHKSSRVKYLVVFDDKHLAHVRTTHFPSKVKRIKDWLISWAEREEDALLCFNFCEILDLFGYIDGVCMVINVLRLFRAYGVASTDAESILSMTLCCLEHVLGTKTGAAMQVRERGYVVILQLFLCHCYLQDDYVPLPIWHKHFFANYCSFKCLRGALMRLWGLRDFRLVVDPVDVERKRKLLGKGIKGRDPSIGGGSESGGLTSILKVGGGGQASASAAGGEVPPPPPKPPTAPPPPPRPR